MTAHTVQHGRQEAPDSITSASRSMAMTLVRLSSFKYLRLCSNHDKANVQNWKSQIMAFFIGKWNAATLDMTIIRMWPVQRKPNRILSVHAAPLKNS